MCGISILRLKFATFRDVSELWRRPGRACDRKQWTRSEFAVRLWDYARVTASSESEGSR
jgi:hypothetical protein